MEGRWGNEGSEGTGPQDESGKVLFEIDVMRWLSSSGVNNPGTHVSEPVQITCFSRDGSRKVTYDSREELQTFEEPKLPANLGDGFETYVPKADDGDVGFEPILRALLKSPFDIDKEADVVTFRNNLNKIGTTPYENRDEWEFDCALVGKTVFLDVRRLDDSRDASQKIFMYYGYRFESLCTGKANEAVNANSEFCSISRMRLANHRILMCSEIDCAVREGEKGGNPLRQYVELKTMKAVDNDRALSNMYRHRFLKYWLQSYLAGVRRVLIGLRSESGTLLNTKWVRTSEMPREARHHFDSTRARSRWDPFVCINFLSCVLAYVREACGSKPGSTIRVRLNPSTKVVQGMLVSGPHEMIAPRVQFVREEFSSERGE